MTALVRYDEACRALAEAYRVDEVKSIRDHAAAVVAAARIAKNDDLVRQATEIKLRAERRAGELLLEMAESGERDAGRGGDRKSQSRGATVKLEDIGVSKSQSSRWQSLARLPEEHFERKISETEREIERSLVATRSERQADKKTRREEREQELAQNIRALPERRYGVIYADPEWKFEVYSRDSGMDRAADNHYPTSDLDAICARDVASIAADDCVLFLWVTTPMLGAFHRVLEAWGFAYKSCFVWAKDRVGTGYWTRDKSEHLVIATRGNVPAPAMGEQFESLQPAPVGEHSAKPEIFAEIIEAYFPHLPKIELNRRGAPRPGWDAWGNEATS